MKEKIMGPIALIVVTLVILGTVFACGYEMGYRVGLVDSLGDQDVAIVDGVLRHTRGKK